MNEKISKLQAGREIMEMMLLMGIDTLEYSARKIKAGGLFELREELFTELINKPSLV